MELLWGALVMGLAGNLHCVGMCGPIALAIPVQSNTIGSRVFSTFLYNAGRVFTYGVIGATFGLLGEGIVISGYQQTLSIIIGALIIAMVLIPAVARFGKRESRLILRFTSRLKNMFRKQFSRKTYGSLFTIGLLNGLLPCGLVYLAVAGAIISGTWQDGALYMMVFGAGTLPVMLILPLLGDLVSQKLRSRINKALPVIMFVFGVLFVLRGMDLGIPYLSPEMSCSTPEATCCH